MDDLVRIFGLGQRDLSRKTGQSTVADLTPRQIGLVLSGCHKWVVPADLLSTGGDAAARLRIGMCVYWDFSVIYWVMAAY